MLIPAQVFIAVCGFRCVFPNSFKDCIVLHDVWQSSIWLTRFMATFAEIFWLYQLSVVATDLNHAQTLAPPQFWIDACANIIVFLVCLAQCCVWSSIVFETDILMWYEELNWTTMFILNTIINLYFFFSGEMEHSKDPRWACVYLSLIFGAIYLPFSIGAHLPHISSDYAGQKAKKIRLNFKQAKKGCLRSIFHRQKSEAAKDWGGNVGAFWMVGYWIGEPFWLLFVAHTYSQHLLHATK